MSLNIENLLNENQEAFEDQQQSLKLFLVRSSHYGYDTYDSFLIACFKEEDANKFHPRSEKGDNIIWDEASEAWTEKWYSGGERVTCKYFNTTWADNPNKTEVQFIGSYSGSENEPIILMRSFNAG
jgi:hypothetical protein